MNLTRPQQRVLDVICQSMAEQGVPPTRAEIAQALGFRTANTAQFHLKALARKGIIDLLPGRSRNIRLLKSALGDQSGSDELSSPSSSAFASGVTLGIPLIGRVAAGQPITAVEHIEAYHQCAGLFSPMADFLLRVRGDSMRDAHIFDGDLLGVHKTSEARSGDIVVARVDDDVTVKTLEISDDDSPERTIRLLPANPAFEPIVIDPESQQLAIEGIAVGTIRPLARR